MIAVQYTPEDSLEKMEEELHRLSHQARTIITLPTLFHYEGHTEHYMYNLYSPQKLAEMVRNNLLACAARGWNAIVTFADNGMTHVFFGVNEGELSYPDVYLQDVIGSC